MRWRRYAAAWWPFVLLGLAYLLTLLRVEGVAGVRDPALLYWHDWQDQALYVRSASALTAGDFSPAAHYYPLLYPVLGVPFLHVWPSQPFFFVDLACYLLAFAGFRRVARAFGFPTWCAVLVFAATTLAQFAIAKVWVEPWTTTPAAALLWLSLGATARLWEGNPVALPRRRPGPSSENENGKSLTSETSAVQLGSGLRRGRGLFGFRRAALVLGIAIGLIPFARPGDAIVAAIIAIAGGSALYRARDRRAATRAAAGFVSSLALLGALYLTIYGQHPSPYMLYSASYGFNFGWLGWKAYVLLVDPRAWFGEGKGLLEVAPWLLLGGAGMLAACLWTQRERRPLVLTAAAVAVTYTVLMLAYVDLLPTGLWRFNNVHYFKWVLPLFGLFGVRFVCDAWKRPRFLVTVVPILLLLTIRVESVRVADDAPARMVIFPAPVGAEWTPTYFATAWTTDRSGEQRNAFDYHQMLVQGRVRVVALRRPFTGDERWIGSDRVRAQLEGRDTGGYAPLYLTGPWPKKPLARYGLRVSFGLPRWFGRGDVTP